jgi:molecular chaperone GrpE
MNCQNVAVLNNGRHFEVLPVRTPKQAICYKVLNMTRKEKIDNMKQHTAGKKKTATTAKEHPAKHNKELEKLQEELKTAAEKVKELQDKYLRLSAEFDNYRKRTMKEKSEMIKTASEDLLRKIIPVVDDLERGLNAVNSARDLDAVKEGMSLIYGRFRDFLQQNGIREIEALNQEFTTDLHEAITKIPAPEEQLKGKVVDVIEKGYYLHDKVIRYPKVVVGE